MNSNAATRPVQNNLFSSTEPFFCTSVHTLFLQMAYSLSLDLRCKDIFFHPSDMSAYGAPIASLSISLFSYSQTYHNIAIKVSNNNF